MSLWYTNTWIGTATGLPTKEYKGYFNYTWTDKYSETQSTLILGNIGVLKVNSGTITWNEGTETATISDTQGFNVSKSRSMAADPITFPTDENIKKKFWDYSQEIYYPRTKTDYTVTISTTARKSGASFSGGSTTTHSLTIPARTKYTITYDANGGTNAPANQYKWYYNGGSASDYLTYNVAITTSTPTRTGYTFQGWATSSTGSVVYTPNSSYTANANVKLYAVWQINTYTLTADAKNGSIPQTEGWTVSTSQTTATKSLTHGSKYGTLPIPTKSNCEFLGWYTETFSGQQVSSDTEITNNNTIYAHWKIKVLFVSPNMTDEYYTTVKEIEMLSGQSLNSSGQELPEASKNYYNFEGWYTAETGGTQIDKNTIFTENTIIYAHWTPINYTINLKNNTSEIAVITWNRSISEGINLNNYTPSPRSDGWIFIGWSKSQDSAWPLYTGTYIPEPTLLIVNLYVVWNFSATMNYYEDENSLVAYKSESISVNTPSSETFLASSPPNTSTKDNYTFEGWEIKENIYNLGQSIPLSNSLYDSGTTNISVRGTWDPIYVAPQFGSNFTAYRCNSSGNNADEGTYGKLVFNYISGKIGDTPTSCSFTGKYYEVNTDSRYGTSFGITDNNGNCTSDIFGGDPLTPDSKFLDITKQYTIEATMTCNGNEYTKTTYISTATFIIDVAANGKGLAFGAPSIEDGLKIAYPTTIGTGLLPYYESNEVDLTNIQLITGKFNAADSDASFIVGNGTADNARSNSFVVKNNGIVLANNTNAYNTTLQVGTLTASNTLTLPTSSGTIALTSNITDEKVATEAAQGSIAYYPILSSGNAAASIRQVDSKFQYMEPIHG